MCAYCTQRVDAPDDRRSIEPLEKMALAQGNPKTQSTYVA